MAKQEKRKEEHIIEEIDVKRATKIAARYLKEIVDLVRDIRVEEVEMSSDESFWFITLSYEDVGGPFSTTKYKIFKIVAKTGEVLSMKIKTIE